MKKILLLLSLLTLLTLASCTTTQNISPPAINVAPSLSQQDTKSAILFTLTDSPTPNISSEKIKILNAALRDHGRYKEYWFYDGQGNDVINASFVYRHFYMLVKISYKNKNIKLTIVKSRNLQQDGHTIHKKALVYLGGLDKNIRATLGGFERIKAQTTNKIVNDSDNRIKSNTSN